VAKYFYGQVSSLDDRCMSQSPDASTVGLNCMVLKDSSLWERRDGV